MQAGRSSCWAHRALSDNMRCSSLGCQDSLQSSSLLLYTIPIISNLSVRRTSSTVISPSRLSAPTLPRSLRSPSR
ncbi:hypothetical protein IEO21_06363 [Rhodonia placenta]|uniref:Uncharacterized protein n=1 Tax=Rhodonia placenta TaxID=104341 RepID=A0A8H7P059_9APHY|nr:hypothetical protein IEO21_06363 [Postia placenta]